MRNLALSDDVLSGRGTVAESADSFIRLETRWRPVQNSNKHQHCDTEYFGMQVAGGAEKHRVKSC